MASVALTGPAAYAQSVPTSPSCDSLSARYDRLIREHPFDPVAGLLFDSPPVPAQGWEHALRLVEDAAGASYDSSIVRLSFFVTEQGKAECVIVRPASPEFVGRITEVLEDVEFEPARIGGEAILVRWAARIPYFRK